MKDKRQEARGLTLGGGVRSGPIGGHGGRIRLVGVSRPYIFG